MNGHLHLTAACYDNGQTYLRQQSFRAPLHLSKPHDDAGALVVNVVNPTAGMFDGDVIDCRVTVESRARVVLTTPSANRVYRARSDRPALMTQEFTVMEGGFLEFYPEPMIPQGGALYHQQTRLHVQPGGGLLFFEWLAPGRVARGEVFEYQRLQWDTDVFHGAQLVARERYTLDPRNESLEALNAAHPGAHYLGCFWLGDFAFPAEAVEALQTADSQVGFGPLPAGGWVVKALCADSLSTRRLLKALRATFYAAMGRPMPMLGRM